MSIMSDIAKNDAYYHPEKHKLIGVNIDSSAFVRADGSLDVDALVDECINWANIQFKKIDDAAEGKKEG